MAKAKLPSAPMTEEFLFRSDNAFLSLLLNRRTGLIRVVDFRAGSLPSKRLFIQSVAKREGASKVIILVEKDEVSSWTRIGFQREGSVPGFYKRSDAYLCGCVIDGGAGDAAAQRDAAEARLKLADKAVQAAKKAAEDLPAESKTGAVQLVEAEEALLARDEAWKKDRPLGAFEAFGRDADRMFMSVAAKKGRTNFLCAEFQDCFGHSLLEVLHSPTNASEGEATLAMLRSMNDTLRERGIVSSFVFVPIDDLALASVCFAAGFRKTGVLDRGVRVGEERRDAILWTQKLANPAADQEEDEVA